jgi:hypothetical protein
LVVAELLQQSSQLTAVTVELQFSEHTLPLVVAEGNRSPALREVLVVPVAVEAVPLAAREPQGKATEEAT